MLDGQETQIFNVPINDMLNLVRKPLENNQPVWIAVDWDKYHSCEHSSLDIGLYDFKRLGYYPIDKGVSLEYRLTVPNHAVLLIGYNMDKEGNIDKWLIENSHGDQKCKLGKNYEVNKKGKGYYTMTTDWFRHFVFQIVIEKKYLSGEINDYLNRDPIYIEPWGAIGCEMLKA
jgi:bleomycin hydrolase